MVARRAHNPKVVGSNPAPATKYQTPRFNAEGFCFACFLFPVSCRLRFLPDFPSGRNIGTADRRLFAVANSGSLATIFRIVFKKADYADRPFYRIRQQTRP